MRPNQLKALLKLGRFRFIFAGFLLYCLGALWAVYQGSAFDPGSFAAGYLILFPAHLSVSYSNDYFDRDSDRAGSPGPVSGGSGVLQEYPELTGWARGIALALIASSLVLGVVFAYLNIIEGWFLLFILAGNALGWFYSAPPLRLSRTRLGEAAMAVTMGFLVPGMGYYMIRGGFDTGFLLLALPCFFYGYFFMMAVEMPDRESDRISGKKTLVVRRGVPHARYVALLATAFASLSFVIPSLLGFFQPPLALLGIFSVIPLLCSMKGYFSPCTDENCIVKRSARSIAALVVFVILADLSLLAAALYP
jgi:1,4-dihydroxy-2-naphthoate octaprenyltransferase